MPRKESCANLRPLVAAEALGNLLPFPEEPFLEMLFPRLLAESPARQRRVVRGLSSGQLLAAFRQLSAQSRATLHTDAALALAIARAALACSRGAAGSLSAAEERADLRGEAWAAFANALRLAEDFSSAQRAWRRADRLQALGTGSFTLQGENLERKAALARGLRRFPLASQLLRKAQKLYRAQADSPRLARALLLDGRNHHQQGHWKAARGRAIAALEALGEPGGEAEPDLALACHHLIADCLAEMKQPVLARTWMKTYELAYESAGGLVQLRGCWLKGKVHGALEEWQEAALYLDHVRQEFTQRGLLYDAALCGVDLCLVYAQQGRHSKVYQLAREMYPVFTAKEIPREAAATLILFANAAREISSTTQDLLKLAAELEASRRARLA